MKRYIYYIVWMMILALLPACDDDFGTEGANPGDGVTEGMITFRFATEEAPLVVTRADGSKEEESLENVLIFVFNNKGEQLNKVYQQLTVDNRSVNIYLTATRGQTIYALCNLPEGDEAIQLIEQGAITLSELQTKYISIKSEEGAYSGKHIMSGSLPLKLNANGQLEKEYIVKVKRLTAQLNFQVSFEPSRPNERFAVGEMKLFNIPKGSMLLDGGGTDKEEDSWSFHHEEDALLDSLDICAGDYSYVVATDKSDRSGQFFNQGERLEFEVVKNEGTHDSYSASFMMFENRQGRVYDDVSNWENLKELQGKEPDKAAQYGYSDMYRFYQQIHKRGLAGMYDDKKGPSAKDANEVFKRNTGVNADKYKVNPEETGFRYATYLKIRGVYTKKNALGGDNPIDVTYYVYLGSDNYKDFNVCRNHIYTYTIRIYDADKSDTRVDTNPIGGLTVFGDFDEVLDAHPNVTQALLYSPSNWSVRVADPDATPWLEVSASHLYKPRKPGEEPTREQAAFCLTGDAGLHYLYIHTDEYIPPLKRPLDNDTYKDAPRVGKLIFTNRSGKEKVVEIKQYAAQMVIRDRYCVDLAKHAQDTFYVERVLEKKNMQWGFHQYWSFLINDLIDDDIRYYSKTGKKGAICNGLTNTRKLYKTAVEGDKNDIKPAYPEGIPSDIALGYALAKNRDRNGNGKIDYNEILWYLPAYTELQAIAGHINRGSKNCPDNSEFTVDVDWIDENYTFFSSTPFSNDPAGVTSGMSWSVLFSPNDKKNGKAKVDLRSRFFNVICARRYDGWRGPDTGSVDGKVDTDDSWGEDDEEIMDKKE